MVSVVVASATNVVRLPLAERTESRLDRLYEIAPDVREVDVLADQYGLEMPSSDLRHRVDAETAEYILNQVDPKPGPSRTAALRALLRPLLGTAVAACREARDAAAVAAEAHGGLARAKMEGGSWMAPAADRAEALSRHAAELLLAAHARSEEAQGAARAVSLARSGRPWVPFDLGIEAPASLFPEGCVSQS